MLVIAGGILIAVLVLCALVFALILLTENRTAGVTLLVMVGLFAAYLIF